MSYTPTNWKAGDTVTSAKLNKMEQGIANGGEIQVVHYNHGTLDKTWQEIYDGGFGVIAFEQSDDLSYDPIIGIHKSSDNLFIVKTAWIYDAGFETITYSAQSPDDYPSEGDNSGGELPK